MLKKTPVSFRIIKITITRTIFIHEILFDLFISSITTRTISNNNNNNSDINIIYARRYNNNVESNIQK